MCGEPCDDGVGPPPWPLIRDDGRTLRVVDTIAAVEALRIRHKKQYEQGRCDSNSIPRCQLKGTGSCEIGARRHMTLDRESPTLFTISHILAPKDCKAIITTAEAKHSYHQTQPNDLRCYGGDIIARNECHEPYPPLNMPHRWCVLWAPKARFRRYNHIYKVVDQLDDLGKLLWTPGLKAAFEGIAQKGFKQVHAVGIKGLMIHRYEKGEKHEQHSLIKIGYRHDLVNPLGYKVLLFLNGGHVDGDVDSSGGPSNVDGGEIVLYSQQHLIGNSKQRRIAKVAPEFGMAICIAKEHGRNLTYEIKAVTKGVLYMIEFFVEFGGFELPSKKKIVPTKMSQESPKRFHKPKWGTIWDKMRSKKEGDFVWSLWHKVVAINSWRVRFIAKTGDKCLMCGLDIPETIAHRFWDCKCARRAWDYAIGIINSMKAHPNQNGPWKAFHWHHGIFGDKLPPSFSKYSGIWLLLRGITLWTIWVERNDLNFNNTTWDASRVEQTIWNGLLDFARIAWRKALKDSKTEATCDVLTKFHTTWGNNNLLYYRLESELMWNNQAPCVGLVDHT